MRVYLVSMSSALVMAAAVTVVGCGEAGGGDTGSLGLEQMQTTDGQCNAIIANGLRAAQKCFRSEECTPTPDPDPCDDVTAAFAGFFGDGDCLAGFSDGELNGLPGNASIQPGQSNPGAGGPIPGAGKHIGEVICSSIRQCFLCPAIPEDVTACEDDCPQ